MVVRKKLYVRKKLLCPDIVHVVVPWVLVHRRRHLHPPTRRRLRRRHPRPNVFDFFQTN